MRALAVVVVVGFIGGLLSALAVFVTLPDAVLGVGFGIFVFAVIGLLTCFIGIGWTRAMPWYRSLWRAGKATLRGICELF